MSQFWLCYHLMQLIWVCIAFCASSKCLKNSGNMLGQVWTWLHLRMLFRNQLERSRCKLDHTFHRCLCQVVTSNRTAANPWWEITFKMFWDPLISLKRSCEEKVTYCLFLHLPWSFDLHPRGNTRNYPRTSTSSTTQVPWSFRLLKGALNELFIRETCPNWNFQIRQAQHSTETQQAQIRIRLVEHAAQQNMWYSIHWYSMSVCCWHLGERPVSSLARTVVQVYLYLFYQSILCPKTLR